MLSENRTCLNFKLSTKFGCYQKNGTCLNFKLSTKLPQVAPISQGSISRQRLSFLLRKCCQQGLLLLWLLQVLVLNLHYLLAFAFGFNAFLFLLLLLLFLFRVPGHINIQSVFIVVLLFLDQLVNTQKSFIKLRLGSRS